MAGITCYTISVIVHPNRTKAGISCQSSISSAGWASSLGPSEASEARIVARSANTIEGKIYVIWITKATSTCKISSGVCMATSASSYIIEATETSIRTSLADQIANINSTKIAKALSCGCRKCSLRGRYAGEASSGGIICAGIAWVMASYTSFIELIEVVSAGAGGWS